VTVGGRITSARTVSENVRPRPENSSSTIPSQIHANVMYIYVNHRPSEIWLRIRSSFTFNLTEFKLTGRTLFHQHVHAAVSPLVPEYKLVPHSDLTLRCIFARHTLGEFEKRFHDYCLPPPEVFWRSFDYEHCARYEEVIARLCSDRNIWCCAFCDRPLFLPPQCLLN
jgi:hypothetical protein